MSNYMNAPVMDAIDPAFGGGNVLDYLRQMGIDASAVMPPGMQQQMPQGGQQPGGAPAPAGQPGAPQGGGFAAFNQNFADVVARIQQQRAAEKQARLANGKGDGRIPGIGATGKKGPPVMEDGPQGGGSEGIGGAVKALNSGGGGKGLLSILGKGGFGGLANLLMGGHIK